MIGERKCECKWDVVGVPTVLGLCAEHHAYMQRHYVQVTGTMMRIDSHGKMRDYEVIPDQVSLIKGGLPS